MNKIKKILESGVNQKELAEKLGVSQAHISQLKRELKPPSRRIELLIEELYFKERKEHPNKRIESIIKLLEALPDSNIEDIQKNAKEKKLLRDYENHSEAKAA